jgi:hypothetical protein
LIAVAAALCVTPPATRASSSSSIHKKTHQTHTHAHTGAPDPPPDSPLCGWTRAQLAELDGEGRVVITHHGVFTLINVYGALCV